MAKPPAHRRPYFLIAGGCLLAGLIVGWVPLASQVDSYHYDWMMRLYPPPSPAKDSLILEIDDHSLREFKGMRNIRPALARALMLLADGKPKAVAIDLILAEESDEKGDPLLAEAMRRTRNLVLSADLTDADAWEQPDALFLPAAAAVGHVHADPDSYDGVSRQVQLEKIGNRIRLWALALEAYKLSIGASDIVETPSDLQVGDQVIPVPRRVDRGRPMFIRYRKGHIPRVPLRQLLADPKLAARFDGKVVFIGVTSQSQARDTLVTPISTTIQMPGVEIHAHIYEAIAQRDFLWPAGNLSVLMAASLLVLSAAIVFAFLNGKLAYGIGALVILAAHGLPHLLFPQGIIFPLMAPAACA
ncbi:MAG TPA: CHASE2 domain-containing protein, partial [Bryobacteraceae bacterium]|nr:CHASE2 domain-containing protein [Bryobacteraceae bacterium]